MENIWNTIIQFFVSNGPRILLALIVLIVGWLIIKLFENLIKKSKRFKALEKNVQNFLYGFVRVFLHIILIISVIGILNFPMTSILAALASAGLAIGLALQGALANFAAGLMILIFKPFKLGDYIDNGSHSGSVESITIIYTKLKTPDNKLITIPNKAVMDSSIINYTVKDARRIDILLKTSVKSDTETVKNIMLASAANCGFALSELLPAAMLHTLSENAMDFLLRVWVKSSDYWAAYYDLLENLKRDFDTNNIQILHSQLHAHIEK